MRKGPAIILSLALVIAVLGYRNFHACERWRSAYLHLVVAEMFKNSPVIMTDERIMQKIGRPPWACTVPTPNEQDIADFRPAGG